MPFDRQPELRGNLVRVRPLRPEDFDDLYAVGGDPLIWEQHPEHERYKLDVFTAFFEDAIASGGALAVLSATTGEVIGTSRFDNHDPAAGEIEIGWTFLARSHWGGAANGELKALMIAHAFRFVERVVFLVGPENHRSQRALEKIGAARAGTRPDGVLFEIRRPRKM